MQSDQRPARVLLGFLAAALAGAIANGSDIPTAVKEAQEYTWQSLSKGFRPGMGQFVPDRMFWARPPESEEKTKAE